MYLALYIPTLTPVSVPEPEFLNFLGAQELIPRNQSLPAYVAWRAGGQPYSYSVPRPHDCLKIPALGALSLLHLMLNKQRVAGRVGHEYTFNSLSLHHTYPHFLHI
jgi:hypothetical protein